VAPYHALVPSFGDWGFMLAGRGSYAPPTAYPVPLRFLTPEVTPALFDFPADIARVPAEPNRMNEQSLVRIFEAEWRRVNH
jgi:spermidine synthase